MTRPDMMKLIGAVAALVGVVALISPPTKPLSTAAGDWREQLPVETGTPAPAPSATPVPATAFAHPPAPAPPAVETASSIIEPPAEPALVPRNDPYPTDDFVARRFRQGYHWATRNGIDDERDCYREPGDPFTDGCLDALTSDDRRFGDALAEGRFRHSPWGR